MSLLSFASSRRCTLVAECGLVLERASEELRADREIVLTAVAECGHALKHASEELRAEREVVLEAVTKMVWCGLGVWYEGRSVFSHKLVLATSSAIPTTWK